MTTVKIIAKKIASFKLDNLLLILCRKPFFDGYLRIWESIVLNTTQLAT